MKPTREWVQEQQLIGAITRANERLAALGLGKTCAIVYSGGAARLLSASGREMRVIEGPPALACGLLSGIVELALRRMLEEETMNKTPILNDLRALKPADGKCPLCGVQVAGAELDGKFLPNRGRRHAAGCKYGSASLLARDD
jgi:hypothetical protein